MTTQERMNVRQQLINADFARIDSTHDAGDGRYTETWRSNKDGSLISLTWDKKSYDIPEEIGKIVAAFENAAGSAVTYVGGATKLGREREAHNNVRKAAKICESRLSALFRKV